VRDLERFDGDLASLAVHRRPLRLRGAALRKCGRSRVVASASCHGDFLSFRYLELRSTQADLEDDEFRWFYGRDANYADQPPVIDAVHHTIKVGNEGSKERRE